MENLEEEYDVIIIGTGVTESIASGALSRSMRVLHLDTQHVYGSHYRVCTSVDAINLMSGSNDIYTNTNIVPKEYRAINEHASKEEAPLKEYQGQSNEMTQGYIIENKEIFQESMSQNRPTQDFKEQSKEEHSENQKSCSDKYDNTTNPKIGIEIRSRLLSILNNTRNAEGLLSKITTSSQLLFVESVVSQSRDFNLELTPKMLFSKGEMVPLIISSGAGSFLEFRLIEKLYLWWDNVMTLIPGRKEDIFIDDTMTLVEKRRLMKFLTFAMQYESAAQLHQGIKVKNNRLY